MAATELAIIQYQDLMAKGGWPVVPDGQTLKIGSKGKSVVILRQRLIATGDLDAEADDCGKNGPTPLPVPRCRDQTKYKNVAGLKKVAI